MHKLKLSRINDHVYRVLADQDEHVGNLKFINGIWKFKAIGYNKNGDIMPGWGSLTDRHNTTFDTLDEALINAKLAPTWETHINLSFHKTRPNSNALADDIANGKAACNR